MKQVIDVIVNWFGAVDEENVDRFEARAVPWVIGLEDRSWWKYTAWGTLPSFGYADYDGYKDSGLWLVFKPSEGDEDAISRLCDDIKRLKCRVTLVSHKGAVGYERLIKVCKGVRARLPRMFSCGQEYFNYGNDFVPFPNQHTPVISVGRHRNVYKYMPAQFAIDNVLKQRIKVSTLYDVNDDNEWMFKILKNHGAKSIPRQKISSLLRRYEGKVRGLISFSAAVNDGRMWDEYADCGRGVMLEYEVPDDVMFHDIEYTDEWLQLKLSDLHKGLTLEQFKRIFFRKDLRWRNEGEKRLVVPLAIVQKIGKLMFFNNWGYGIHLVSATTGPNSDAEVIGCLKEAFQLSGRGTLSIYDAKGRCEEVKGGRKYYYHDYFDFPEEYMKTSSWTSVKVGKDCLARPTTRQSGPEAYNYLKSPNLLGMDVNCIVDPADKYAELFSSGL